MYSDPPNQSQIEILAHTEQCVVCGDAADGFHYGVRSCRGCNAFFRRAVTFNMTFTCRRGGRCPVDKNARCACRACRLSKCFSVGMDRKAVQPKRDVGNVMNNGHNSFDQNEQDFDMRITGNSPNFDMNDMTSPGSAFTPMNNLSSEFTPLLSPSPPPESSLLLRQCYEFVEQKRRRRALLCKSLEEILSEDISLREPASIEDFTLIFQAQMVLMFEWVEKLPEFRMLRDPNDKTILLKTFALRYMLLDDVYHTHELGYNDRMILVNNNFIMPGHPATLKSEEVFNTDKLRQMMYGDRMHQLIQELIVPMSRTNILFGEIMTIRRLVFWNPGSINLSPYATQICAEASNNAMKELQQYLEQEMSDDNQSRIQFILLIVPALCKHTKTMMEIFKEIPSFGKMSEWNSFMDEVYNGI